jgi:hypothetical protein
VIRKSLRFLFFVFVFPVMETFCQDTTEIKKKEIRTDTTAADRARKRANKAAIFSAVLPGSGQAFNHKYWKLPIIYGGFGALIYFISTNNKEYQNYVTAIRYRNDGDPLTTDQYPRLTSEDLTARKDYFRRNRDLSYILSGVLYVLNIVDAYVDSQLIDFDVSDNLSIHSSPVLLQSVQKNTFAGIQLTLTFK